MNALLQLLLAYIIGGFTFIPLAILLFGVYSFIKLPVVQESAKDVQLSSTVLERDGDDERFKPNDSPATRPLEKANKDSDVAAGYFAVCREYVPGGINGKPPERITLTGEAVPTETQSVYQSVYRSIFDRTRSSSVELNGPANRPPRRARNVFYIVLRHGHLMLYDDSEQLEVRYVISVAHHDISIYGGGEAIPEGELFIKRNAIALHWRQHDEPSLPETKASKPFYLFCENCSEKEDFYYSLLQSSAGIDNGPLKDLRPLDFEVGDIVKLVQNLHSSEDHLQTRWINTIIGRLFLAFYRSQNTKNFIRNKISRKISRVKIPAFLSDISITKIDLGSGAPSITNPKMRDLTVDGECSIEVDIGYSGDFKIEVATTARIELGARFKAREVTLVLAVLVKKLEGRGILRFKKPPSNRAWFAFESMPKLQMSIEPIVSSRQITYGIILRAIEARIREVIAETLVLPNWDDLPFTDTTLDRVRGGIWETPAPEVEDSMAIPLKDTGVENGAEEKAANPVALVGLHQNLGELEKVPHSSDEPLTDVLSNYSLGGSTAEAQGDDASALDISTVSSMPLKSSSELPIPLRSGSFTSSPAMPFVDTDKTSVEAEKVRSVGGGGQDAASVMTSISNRSLPSSPVESPVGSPSNASGRNYLHERKPSTSSQLYRRKSSLIADSAEKESLSHDLAKDNTKPTIKEAINNASIPDKAQTSAALHAATTAAKKWGFNVLNRNNTKKGQLQTTAEEAARLKSQPIGRGKPIPSLGIPPISHPRPPPETPPTFPTDQAKPSPSPRPTTNRPNPNRKTPERNRTESSQQHQAKLVPAGEELLVVAAPMMDSDSASPSEVEDSELEHDKTRFPRQLTESLQAISRSNDRQSEPNLEELENRLEH